VNRRAPLALTVGLAAALALAGCSSTPSDSTSSDLSGSAGSAGTPPSDGAPVLKVNGAYMPQPIGDLGAGFLTVANSGGTADRLTSVTSDVSDDITIHRTENQRMHKVKAFDIPAGGELDLARGGNHIMFMSLKRQPEEGQKIGIELHFEKTDPIKVELPVKGTSYNPAQH
jgi:copper(I)-binding protein